MGGFEWGSMLLNVNNSAGGTAKYNIQSHSRSPKPHRTNWYRFQCVVQKLLGFQRQHGRRLWTNYRKYLVVWLQKRPELRVEQFFKKFPTRGAFISLAGFLQLIAVVRSDQPHRKGVQVFGQHERYYYSQLFGEDAAPKFTMDDWLKLRSSQKFEIKIVEEAADYILNCEESRYLNYGPGDHKFSIIQDVHQRFISVLKRDFAIELYKQAQELAAEKEEADDDSDLEYEVEEIVEHKIGSDGKRLYLVKWKNYDDSWNTWQEPESFSSGNSIKNYEKTLKAERKRKAETDLRESIKRPKTYSPVDLSDLVRGEYLLTSQKLNKSSKSAKVRLNAKTKPSRSYPDGPRIECAHIPIEKHRDRVTGLLNKTITPFEYTEVGEIIDADNPATKTQIASIHKDKVYGLFAKKDIPQGFIIEEYTGLVCKLSESQMGICLENELSKTTVFELRGSSSLTPIKWGPKPQDQMVIDAALYQGSLVYMNDFRDPEFVNGNRIRTEKPSCERRQNVVYQEVLVNGWPHVFAYSCRPIPKGSELLADYGEAFWDDFVQIVDRQRDLKRIISAQKQKIHADLEDKYRQIINRMERKLCALPCTIKNCIISDEHTAAMCFKYEQILKLPPGPRSSLLQPSPESVKRPNPDAGQADSEGSPRPSLADSIKAALACGDRSRTKAPSSVASRRTLYPLSSSTSSSPSTPPAGYPDSDSSLSSSSSERSLPMDLSPPRPGVAPMNLFPNNEMVLGIVDLRYTLELQLRERIVKLCDSNNEHVSRIETLESNKNAQDEKIAKLEAKLKSLAPEDTVDNPQEVLFSKSEA